MSLLFGAALAMGCTNDMGDDGRGGKEPLYEKENSNVMGTVTCDGYGVAGVVVSDGVSVTKTDKSGRYWLENVAVDREPEIFMSIPSGYETVERKGMGQAFYHRAANVEGVQTFNFTLKKVEQSGYELLVIADSHVLGGASIYGSTEDVNLYNNTFIPEYKKYAQKCLDEGRRVYSVHCGDMTQHSAWKKYDLEDYREDTNLEEVLAFNAIGNHDHNSCSEFGLGSFDNETQHLARKSFRETLGPAYYSVNIGTEHYVFLDNIYVNKHETAYDEKVSQQQLAWLAKDIEAVDKSKIKGVVLVMHAPMYDLNGKVICGNGDKVLDRLRNFPLTILIGHNHIDRTNFLQSSAGKPIVHFLHPTLAGVAWLGKITSDGVPRSFVAYNFKDGRSTKRLFVPFDEGEDVNKPYRLYDNKGSRWTYPITEFSGQENKRDDDKIKEDASSNEKPAVIVNFWGAVRCELVMDGAEDTTNATKGGMFDLAFRDWFWPSFESSDRNSIYNDGKGTLPDWQDPYRFNTHIWRFVPKDPSVPVMLDIYDAHDKCTRVTLYAK